MSQLLYECFKRQLPRKPTNSVVFLNRRALTGKTENMTSMATSTHRTLLVVDHGKLRLERPSTSETTQTALALSLQRFALQSSGDDPEHDDMDHND
ncbi:protein UL19 [macacine betaherpesvirus 3]|uniref:Rh35.1 n=1 Tax=Rhesus cytomegalovirus (strain 68-1) TaxID=47929 RepID=I3WF47_RHCM6|nr:Rh35.1 [macacine betaherpesvirus 3]QMS44165.1 Rh35.1 [synthetic construct]QQL10352.1 Rh35.1 [macacine betaherpesvirus 3]QQL10531.1 Rh35.1 [Rhesus cytomegalovirus strain 68-1.2]QQL10713.1 Rh35.1 [Rhesus cytomegalovirus strain 68-1_FL]